MTDERVRIGIVGCGRVAEYGHIPAALQAEGVELAALVDSSRARLEELSRAYRLSCRTATFADDLIGHVDAVVVCLPNHLHYPVARRLLEQGVHVLCEKPLGTSSRDAEHLVEVADRHGRALAVGYMRRWEPSHGLMKRLLDDGLIGELDRFEFEDGTPGGWAPMSRYNLQRSHAGGGVLMTNGCHLVDRMLRWFGKPSRIEFQDDSRGGVEANCLAQFEFVSGVTGRMLLSKTRLLRNGVRVHGRLGSLAILHAQHGSVTFHPAAAPGRRHEITDDAGAAPSATDCFRLQLEDFARAIRTGGPPRVTGRDASAVLAVIEECYRVRTPLTDAFHPVSRAVTVVRAVSRERVLVTGATGFVGSRLCEVLHGRGDRDVRPFVRSAGTAAHLARYPFEFAAGDILNPASVQRAAEGCAAVVHVARGSDRVMLRGLEAVLRAAVQARVRRFVHISSVAVYGDDPPPESAYQTAVPRKTANAYGNIKLEQERLVARYGRRFGLPVVILRPPHVWGPYSHFVQSVAQGLRDRTLPLVEGGTNICNLVYVDNLIQAIILALDREDAVGETFFVTDTDRVTWRRCLGDLAAVLDLELIEARREQLGTRPRPSAWSGLGRLSRALASQEVRAALMDVPAGAAALRVLSRGYERLPQQQRQYVRARLAASARMPPSKPVGLPEFDSSNPLIAAQGRTVVHACDKAERLLGYSAQVDYGAALAITSRWLRWPDGEQDAVTPAHLAAIAVTS